MTEVLKELSKNNLTSFSVVVLSSISSAILSTTNIHFWRFNSREGTMAPPL